jgi:glycosyltransferase involved in cell wall biosynthesis
VTRFPESWPALDVVLGHDWLTGMRGGERVLELLCRAFPRAPIVTLLGRPQHVSETIRSHRLVCSALQRLPRVHAYYRYLLPLFPAAVAGLRCPPGRLLITTSHCAIKSLRPAPGMKHLCYCFTPMRYVWSFEDEYFGRNPLKRALLAPVSAGLRAWDRRTAAGVDRFVTLSRHVRNRIWDSYERDADVVYPPVNVGFHTPASDGPAGPPAEPFDLIVSALVPYKRIDLAVKAYTRMGRTLRIVGSGSLAGTLKRQAGPTVEFLGRRSDEEIRDLYRQCRLLVFPGEEDFGIVPVEAQACGRPVVAFGRGGVTESVIAGETGVFFKEQTEDSLIDAVRQCDARSWDPARIRANAERFGGQPFIDGMARSVEACLKT